MKVDFDGRVWQLDTSHIRFKHAMVIQQYTGLSIADWEDSVNFETDDDGSFKNPPPRWLKSVAALYWLMLAQNDDAVSIDDVDFDYAEFYAAVIKGIVAEAKQEAAAAADEERPTSRTSTTADPASPESATQTTTTPASHRREGGPLTES